jgi:peptidoglycan/LPS O-acetylase OafA/YrhL
VILGLVLLARFIPKPAPREPVPPTVRPWRYFLIGFLGMVGQFFLIYTGAESGSFPFEYKMILLLIYDLLILALVLRWNRRGAAWDDRHRLALINGALSFFLILGPVTVGTQYPVMYYSNPVFLLILWLIARHVNRRVTKPSSSGEIVIP